MIGMKNMKTNGNSIALGCIVAFVIIQAVMAIIAIVLGYSFWVAISPTLFVGALCALLLIWVYVRLLIAVIYYGIRNRNKE